jgi:outer membrane protein
MLHRRARLTAAASLAALLAATSSGANAETLAEAISLAYQTNPTLQQQRAQQRALDETVVQARSSLRPTLSAGVAGTYQDPAAPGQDSFNPTADISVSQSLYTGGRISAGVDAATADVLRGRENLRAVEAQVLTNVIQAYVDVRRDVEALRINQENVAVLQRQLEESTARFEVGEITRTDVAQSEARLAAARASLSSAEAQLSVSRAAYAAVVGQAPTSLDPEPALPGLPASFDAAMETAERENAQLRAAQFSEQAASERVAQARSAYLPTVGLSAGYGGALRGNFGEQDAFTATANVSIPLFTGGLNGSRVRQALENANAAQIAVEGARRNVLQTVSQTWAQVLSSRASLTANEEQVRAARIAAEGVRQEAQVGLRTTLDVLNAELELRNAELSLVQARRNEYLAAAQLLAAMGRLEAQDLVAGVTVYDPKANFNRVRNKGFVPWEPIVETIDSIAAPPPGEPVDEPDAPIDRQLKEAEAAARARGPVNTDPTAPVATAPQ